MLLLIATAVAAPLAELPDAATLADAAIAGVTRFPGCAAFTGEVRQTNQFNVFRTPYRMAWAGTLRDGEWTPWAYRWIERTNDDIVISFDVGEQSYPFLASFFGRMEGEAPDEDGMVATSRQLLVELLDVVETPVELETVERAPDGIRYRRELSSRWSIFGRRENVVEVLFDADTLRPRRWEVTIAHPVRVEEGTRIVRMTLSLEVDADGWPVRDVIDATGGYGILSLRMQRELTFARGACAG